MSNESSYLQLGTIPRRSVANVNMVCVEKARNFILRKGKIRLYSHKMIKQSSTFFLSSINKYNSEVFAIQ